MLQVRDLKTYFYTDEGIARAVDGVSFSLEKGRTLGLVGESGCGKSVTALSILRLLPQPPGKIAGGEILFQGRNLVSLPEREMLAIRGAHISMIFQEPMTSLNPVFTIGEQVAEVFRIHRDMNRKEARSAAGQMLERVKIPAAGNRMRDFPHHLSGGMRQRVMIAMALACTPDLLIADEPTTALDVTIQAQILNLMEELKAEFHSSVLMITHDLGVIAETSDEMAVMYAGHIVEKGPSREIFRNPAHPYTQGLLASIPRRDNLWGAKPIEPIPGNVPSPYRFPPGCRFHPRCRFAKEICRESEPLLEPVEAAAVGAMAVGDASGEPAVVRETGSSGGRKISVRSVGSDGSSGHDQSSIHDASPHSIGQVLPREYIENKCEPAPHEAACHFARALQQG